MVRSCQFFNLLVEKCFHENDWNFLIIENVNFRVCWIVSRLSKVQSIFQIHEIRLQNWEKYWSKLGPNFSPNRIFFFFVLWQPRLLYDNQSIPHRKYGIFSIYCLTRRIAYSLTPPPQFCAFRSYSNVMFWFSIFFPLYLIFLLRCFVSCGFVLCVSCV